jgi:hypothetical protein
MASTNTPSHTHFFSALTPNSFNIAIKIPCCEAIEWMRELLIGATQWHNGKKFSPRIPIYFVNNNYSSLCSASKCRGPPSILCCITGRFTLSVYFYNIHLIKSILCAFLIKLRDRKWFSENYEVYWIIQMSLIIIIWES